MDHKMMQLERLSRRSQPTGPELVDDASLKELQEDVLCLLLETLGLHSTARLLCQRSLLWHDHNVATLRLKEGCRRLPTAQQLGALVGGWVVWRE